MSNPVAEIEITASDRALSSKLMDVRRKFSSFADGLKSTLGKIGVGAASSFFGNLGANIAGKGVDMFEDAAVSSYHFEEKLTRLAIAAHRAPEEMEALRKSVRDASDETGIARNEILAGAYAFQSFTGDMKEAEEGARAFARAAQASDTPVTEIAQLGATLSKTFNISSKEMESAMGVLITEGENGSVELRDMTSLLAGLGPMAARFAGGTGLRGMQEMAATLEALKLGAGSAAEATTQYQAVMMSLVTHSAELKRSGIDVLDKHGQLKSFRDIIDSISKSALIKDPERLKKALGGRGEALLAILDLMKYRNEWDAGLTDMANSGQVVGGHLEQWMASPAGKVQHAWEAAKNKMLDVFTPERIQEFADAMAVAAQAVGKLADGLGHVVGFYKSIVDFSTGAAHGLGWGDESWKQMRREGKETFRRSAELRGVPRWAADAAWNVSGGNIYGALDKYAAMNSRGVSQEDASQEIAFENLVRDKLLAGKRYGVATYADPALGRPRTMDEGYSLTELNALSKQIGRSGMSNTSELTSYALPAAYTAEIKRMTNAIIDHLKTPVTVQIDGTAVVQARRKAPRGTRPGG